MGGRKVFNTFRRINCRIYGALWGGTWPSSSVRLSRQSEIIAVTATMLPVVTWDIVFSLPFSIRWFLCSSPRILPLHVCPYLTTAKNVRIRKKDRFSQLPISLDIVTRSSRKMSLGQQNCTIPWGNFWSRRFTNTRRDHWIPWQWPRRSISG